jgi:UDP-N-acetylmuramate-alanine ligase
LFALKQGIAKEQNKISAFLPHDSSRRQTLLHRFQKHLSQYDSHLTKQLAYFFIFRELNAVNISV